MEKSNECHIGKGNSNWTEITSNYIYFISICLLPCKNSTLKNFIQGSLLFSKRLLYFNLSWNKQDAPLARIVSSVVVKYIPNSLTLKMKESQHKKQISKHECMELKTKTQKKKEDQVKHTNASKVKVSPFTRHPIASKLAACNRKGIISFI